MESEENVGSARWGGGARVSGAYPWPPVVTLSSRFSCLFVVKRFQAGAMADRAGLVHCSRSVAHLLRLLPFRTFLGALVVRYRG